MYVLRMLVMGRSCNMRSYLGMIVEIFCFVSTLFDGLFDFTSHVSAPFEMRDEKERELYSDAGAA